MTPRAEEILADSIHDLTEIRRHIDDDLMPILARELGPDARAAIQGIVDALRGRVWLLEWMGKHAASIALGEELKSKMGIEVIR